MYRCRKKKPVAIFLHHSPPVHPAAIAASSPRRDHATLAGFTPAAPPTVSPFWHLDLRKQKAKKGTPTKISPTVFLLGGVGAARGARRRSASPEVVRSAVPRAVPRARALCRGRPTTTRAPRPREMRPQNATAQQSTSTPTPAARRRRPPPPDQMRRLMRWPMCRWFAPAPICGCRCSSAAPPPPPPNVLEPAREASCSARDSRLACLLVRLLAPVGNLLGGVIVAAAAVLINLSLCAPYSFSD